MSLLYYIPSLPQKDVAPVELDEAIAPVEVEIPEEVLPESPPALEESPLSVAEEETTFEPPEIEEASVEESEEPVREAVRSTPLPASIPVIEEVVLPPVVPTTIQVDTKPATPPSIGVNRAEVPPRNEKKPVPHVLVEGKTVEVVEQVRPEVVEEAHPEIPEAEEALEVAEAPRVVEVLKPVEVPKPQVRDLAPTVGAARRRRIDKGTTYRTIERLIEERDRTTDRKERSRINAAIRKERAKRENHSQEMEFLDLSGNTIGFVSFEQQNLDDYPDAVCLGKTDNIQAVRFEFVRSAVADETMVRTTALLTEKATKKVIKFIERRTRDKFRSVDPARRGRKFKRSKSDIRKYVQRRSSYVFPVAGFEAHLSTKGRVSIYTALTDSEMSSISIRRFRKGQKPHDRYIKHTNYKVWIDKTQDDFNELIGQTFFGLRQVLDEVL